MLSQELRPFDFDEMAGQDENKSIIKAIIANPEQAPKCLILFGAFGSGKTSLARILARRLNHITDRNFDLLNSPFYYEYDSTVIGNVETIRQLRDQFTISYGEYYRVIVFDETHSISNAAQNALLKVLEEAQGRVFFVLCTTDVNKLLPTIRSRSLELVFSTVPRDRVIENLRKVSVARNISLSDEVLALIADRSGGHMRNAHMLVDKFLLLGEEEFKASIKSAIRWYCAFFIAIQQDKKDYALASINTLMQLPLEDLQADWNTVMVESMKAFNGFDITHTNIRQLVTAYGRQNFKKVIALYFQPFMQSMFIDMPYFQATLLYIYAVLSKSFQPDESLQTVQAPQQNARLRAR